MNGFNNSFINNPKHFHSFCRCVEQKMIYECFFKCLKWSQWKTKSLTTTTTTKCCSLFVFAVVIDKWRMLIEKLTFAAGKNPPKPKYSCRCHLTWSTYVFAIISVKLHALFGCVFFHLLFLACSNHNSSGSMYHTISHQCHA